MTPAGTEFLKFLFVAETSLCGDLAWRIKLEGHSVKYFIKDKDDKDAYDGFVEKVQSWEDHTDWADVIVFDDIGFGEKADILRGKGKLIIGGSKYTDRIENDRGYGQEEMAKAGISILPNRSFSDFDEAIRYIEENPNRYVFKPCGFISSEEKDLLFVGQKDSGEDIIEILSHNKVPWSKVINEFQLQKYAEGVEIAVGAFFNGQEFILPINVNFEHKRLFPGDIGPNTGEMGTLMFWSKPNEIFRRTLQKMKPRLVESGYAGYIDINCIVNETGVYPLEFTSRFGVPTIQIQLEGILNATGRWIYQLARGESFELETKRGFQIGVVLAVPPFPFDDEKQTRMYKNTSIIFKMPNTEGMHLGDVKLIDGEWRIAGVSGYALIVTGSGITVEEARKIAYGRLENIVLLNHFYRTDIGAKWSIDSDKLQAWGYLQ